MTRRRLAAFVVLTAALTSALSGAVRFDRYVRSRGFAEHIAAALAGPLSARASIGGHHVPDPRTVVVRGLVLELPAAEGTQGGIVSAERVSFHWHRRAGLGDPMEIDGHGLVARLPGGLADLFPRGEGLGSLPDGLERMTARGRVILGPPDGASARSSP